MTGCPIYRRINTGDNPTISDSRKLTSPALAKIIIASCPRTAFWVLFLSGPRYSTKRNCSTQSKIIFIPPVIWRYIGSNVGVISRMYRLGIFYIPPKIAHGDPSLNASGDILSSNTASSYACVDRFCDSPDTNHRSGRTAGACIDTS